MIFSTQKTTFNGRSREQFQPKQLVQSQNRAIKNRTDNLVIEYNIIKRKSNTSQPQDVKFHSSPGSTSKQKRERVEKYEIQKPLKSFFLTIWYHYHFNEPRPRSL